MSKMKTWTLLNERGEEVLTAPVGFQGWLLTRKAHDNPRGDLIRDYQDRASRGHLDDVSPIGGMAGSAHFCYEAQREVKRLVAEWRRSGREASKSG